MKVIFDKKLENGKYNVRIDVTEYSVDEVEKIKRFGPPIVSIAPKNVYNGGRMRDSLPLYDLNYDFEFDLEREAINFVELMKGRIKIAILNLKERKDNFSGKNELQF